MSDEQGVNYGSMEFSFISFCSLRCDAQFSGFHKAFVESDIYIYIYTNVTVMQVVEGMVNCQNSRDKGSPECNSAPG